MNNSRAINRVFTRNVLKDLLNSGSSEVFDYVASHYVDAPDNGQQERKEALALVVKKMYASKTTDKIVKAEKPK